MYMKRALALAEKGVGKTHPNPRVGAVVVNHGEIVGEGWHQRAGEAHAEVNALQDAGEKANGACIYVSLEPCAGHGRTPPCTDAIVKAGIKRVVFASHDPNPNMAGGAKALEAQGIEVLGGVLADEADDLNIAFFHYVRTGMPYIVAKAAISLDGKLATYTHHSQWITGEQARKHAQGERAISDAIVVGVGTLKEDNPSLTVRDVPCQGDAPLRVVMAIQAPRFFEDCKLLDGTAPSRMYVYASNEHENQWRDAGMDVVQVTDLKAALKHLAGCGCLRVMVEGGGKLHASLFEEKLANALLLYQAPLLIGGLDAVNLWHGLGVSNMDECVRLQAVTRKPLGDDMMIRGRLVYAAM
jgi:diaminohydroxyphosphoribosylaminopyrimidine deaminase/5-amino-6-(5-phosphoribosylamino)uracil reductase